MIRLSKVIFSDGNLLIQIVLQNYFANEHSQELQQGMWGVANLVANTFTTYKGGSQQPPSPLEIYSDAYIAAFLMTLTAEQTEIFACVT
jgi:hypothetical protein